MKSLNQKLDELLKQREFLDKKIQHLTDLIKKSEVSKYPKNTPVELIDIFSVRLKNVLDYADVRTLADLEKKSLVELKKYRNLGAKSLDVIIELEKKGIIKLKEHKII